MQFKEWCFGVESGVEFLREIWSGVLVWSLECSLVVESDVEIWRGVWKGVLSYSLEWSFVVESGV